MRDAANTRSSASRTASGDKSIPTHRRCNREAATKAVPHPQNGSKTMSPGLLEAETIRSNNANGFCVGYPTRSRAILFKDGISLQLSVIPFSRPAIRRLVDGCLGLTNRCRPLRP